jgi:hypothetical protein
MREAFSVLAGVAGLSIKAEVIAANDLGSQRMPNPWTSFLSPTMGCELSE